MDDLVTFFRNLFLLKGKSLKGKNCVIIFDEVQLLSLSLIHIFQGLKDHA